MRSIRYAGHDFSELCSAEVVGRTPTPVVPEALEVPGRAGALLVSGRVPTVDVTVRLFLDLGFKANVNALADARHKLAFWLCAVGGGELVLPDEPERTYRDAVLVDVSAWAGLFNDGRCDVVFRLYDPIAYGTNRVERGHSFEVGGTWPTWPVLELVAAAGPAVQVGSGGAFVRIERAFAGGEVVVIDCAAEGVSIDGADARDCVALSSDFFAFAPGQRTLDLSGCSSAETRFAERWV